MGNKRGTASGHASLKMAAVRKSFATIVSMALIALSFPNQALAAFQQDYSDAMESANGASVAKIAAFSTEGMAVAERVMRSVRIQKIDAQSESYAPGEVIVVFKGCAAAEASEASGALGALSSGEMTVKTIPDATCEALAGGDLGQDAFALRDSAALPVGRRAQGVLDFGLKPQSYEKTDETATAQNMMNSRVALVDVPGNMTVGQAVVAAEDDPNVVYAQPNYRYFSLADESSVPIASGDFLSSGQLSPESVRSVVVDDPIAQNSQNDNTVENQWWLNAVRAPEAWEYARCEQKVSVAVLDTGINFDHEDLKQNILTQYAWDAVSGEPLVESPTQSALSHGSHVAGIVAAEANNGVGIAGVSYNAALLPIAVFQASGGRASCDDATLVKAYNYLLSDPSPSDGQGKTVAERTNLHVVNMSLGGYTGEDELLRSVIATAQDRGILTVAAGGNGDDAGNPLTDHSYPSDYDEVMSVVALKDTVERSYWSDYNDCKDIAAPGVDIWSTWYTGNDYHCTSGTSMAAPLVAGCAALLWAYDPHLSVQEVKDALYSTAVDLGDSGRDDRYGWGRVDVAAAIESLGTAHIEAERQTMGRTGMQQLTAWEVRNPTSEHEWEWSVSDDSIATVSPEGVVTAKQAGSVVVSVHAADDASVSGHVSIAVTEITVPGTVVVNSDGVNHQVLLEWRAADAAKTYSVQRSSVRDGVYGEVARVVAQAGMTMYRYVDEDVQPGREYYYRIVPAGRLADADVEGAATDPARGYFTDKALLAARINEAQALVSSAIVSEDGTDVDASENWTTQEGLAALSDEVAKAQRMLESGNARQAVIDAASNKLAQAMVSFRVTLRPGLRSRPPDASSSSSSSNAGSTSNSSSTSRPDTDMSSSSASGSTPEPSSSSSSSSEGSATSSSSSSSSSAGSHSESGTQSSAVTQSRSLAAAKVTLVSSRKVFSGKSQHGSVKSVVLGGETLRAGVDYTVNAKAGKAVGSYKVVVSGKGSYSGTASVTFKITKAVNTMKVRVSVKSVMRSILKKKAKRVAPLSVSAAKGKVTYSKVSGSKYLLVDKSSGKVTVKEGAREGMQSAKVKVTAAGTASYRKAAKVVTVKVVVK